VTLTTFFGDSITAGQYVYPNLRWTNIVSKKFGDENFEVRAVSNETSRQALFRLPNILNEIPPKNLFVQFGLNDANIWASEDEILSRVSLDSFESNLKEIVARARNKDVKNIVLMSNHSVLKILSNGQKLQDRKILYDQRIRDVAIEVNCLLLDVAYHFEAINHSDLGKYLIDSPDLIHLSQLGHELYAKVVWKYIKEKDLL
jgi:lysophospholipase L1-like esterase